jgi:circadian clock protein KaiC
MAKAKTDLSLPTLAKCPTGINGLDKIIDGRLPKGRPSLICGSAGSGKTLFAVQFLVRGADIYNEPGVFFAFEETADELAQNVASLGFDVKALEAQKRLIVEQVRVERREIVETGEYNLEALFIRLGYAIDSIHAKRVVLDTIEALFASLPNEYILRAELRRLFRWFKRKSVTAIITAERGENALTRYGLEEYVSDAVILLNQRVNQQISTRHLRIVKYRGSSNGTNEYPFLIGADGFSVLPVTSLGLQHVVSRERLAVVFPGSMRCSVAEAISEAAPCSFQAWQAAAKAALPPILPTRPVGDTNDVSISSQRSRPARSWRIWRRLA